MHRAVMHTRAAPRRTRRTGRRCLATLHVRRLWRTRLHSGNSRIMLHWHACTPAPSCGEAVCVCVAAVRASCMHCSHAAGACTARAEKPTVAHCRGQTHWGAYALGGALQEITPRLHSTRTAHAWHMHGAAAGRTIVTTVMPSSCTPVPTYVASSDDSGGARNTSP
jgi:hypothetical protein